MRVQQIDLGFNGQAAVLNFPGETVPIALVLSVRSSGDMGEPFRRKAFLSRIGVPLSSFFSPKQRHTRKVALVGEGEDLDGIDGLVSADPILFLGVTVADCLPIALYDRENALLAVLHSGWRGTGICLNALEMMSKRWGTRPSQVAAVFGPCIGPCCYAVDQARAAAFEKEFGGMGPLGPALERRSGKCYINLQAANASLLEQAGVGDLAYCPVCTHDDPRLGSFRREGADSYTRMLAVAGPFRAAVSRKK